MRNVDVAEYGIAVHQEHKHLMCVWPLHRTPPQGYVFAPPRGTCAEMESLLSQQFVETTPARHYSTSGFPETDFTTDEGACASDRKARR
jgi:hypothetical protein